MCVCVMRVALACVARCVACILCVIVACGVSVDTCERFV